MTFQKQPKNSGRRRTLEQVRKDAQAAEYYRQGLTLRQVADKMGIKSSSTVCYMIQRAIRDAQADAVKGPDAFSMMIERIQDHRRKLQDVIDHPCYLAGKDGQIVTMTDPDTEEKVPVIDKGPIVRAITELRHHIELEAKLLDLFPASKSRVEVVTEDVVDREIAKLAKELSEAGQKTEAPGEIRG